MKKEATERTAATAANELTGDELDQVAGGLSYLGGFGTLGIGIGAGPVGIGAGVAHGGPNGDIYGTASGGVQAPSVGITGGAQANVAFGFGDHTFDDVVTGHSTTVDFGIGSVSWNSSGFSVGLGPSGIGISHSDTVNLNHPDDRYDAAINATNGPDHSADMFTVPQLNNWGPLTQDQIDAIHAETPSAPGSLAEQAGINDIGSHPDASGASADHPGTSDTGGHPDAPGSLAEQAGINDIGGHADAPGSQADHPGTNDTGGHEDAPGSLADQAGINDIGSHADSGDHSADLGASGDHGAQGGFDQNAGQAVDAGAGNHSNDNSGTTFGNDFGDPNGGGGNGGGDYGGGDYGGGDYGGGDFGGSDFA